MKIRSLELAVAVAALGIGATIASAAERVLKIQTSSNASHAFIIFLTFTFADPIS